MEQVQFIPNDKGAFAIDENGERIAEMTVGIPRSIMSIYHTGVIHRLKGQGVGKSLVLATAAYARSNNLKVQIYCPFVKSVFSQCAGAYSDIWQRS